MKKNTAFFLFSLGILGCQAIGKIHVLLLCLNTFKLQHQNCFQNVLKMAGVRLKTYATGINTAYFERSVFSVGILQFRIVHFPESFWSAYSHCETFGGNLLQLDNVIKVMGAIGKTMEGNADEFRIDGYSKGNWYQK